METPETTPAPGTDVEDYTVPRTSMDTRHEKAEHKPDLSLVEADEHAKSLAAKEHDTPSPKSRSDASSPEFQDADLEELSLEETSTKALTTLSLDTTDTMSPTYEDIPMTAKPRSDDEESITLPSNPSATSPADLDSLLSPTKDNGFKFPVRESIAGSVAASDTTDDTTDDEARFSTVLLSARQSLDPTHPAVGISLTESHNSTLPELPEERHEDVHEETHDEKRKTLDGNDIVRLIHQNRVHKKTASTSTIVSAHNVPFVGGDASSDEKEKEEAGDVDWNFWGDVVSDYQAYASANPQRLAKAIEQGIPKSLRGMIWQLMSASKEPELEQTYLRLLKEPSPHEKAISRDLGRTFPHHAFFTDGHGIGQENLFNVLKAYSLYDTEVGYCQGLPFVVAILLLNMPDEEAFCLLVRLMHSYDLRGHFLPEMPKLQQRMFQFDRLVEEVLPVLHVHFIRQGIKSSMYCSQWFLTMFSYKFPLDIVFRIYDNVLASGIESLFSFSVVLLYKNEETLLNMKFDQLLVFLNTKMLDIYQTDTIEGENGSQTALYDINQYVLDAVSMNITPFMLDQYANEYDDLVRTRDAQATEMDALRNANRSLTNQVHKLERDLAQLNTEHVEVLNEVVRGRLRHEELESELVRYKLLYAEAMHQSEDALSSHRMSKMSLFSRRSSNNSGT